MNDASGLVALKFAIAAALTACSRCATSVTFVIVAAGVATARARGRGRSARCRRAS